MGKNERLSTAFDEVKPLAAPVIDYIAGLRKMGPNSYTVVTGKSVNGVPELKVDHLAQPLEYASVCLENVLRNMLGNIP